ncbi:MAG: aconitase X catalytic domain-containing protein [Thaumarchaeota archaeon]|nr:aconitase X catalytic domain-containing protein [Nitrososphaerota archaeon]MDE1831550.1 aconitase X catalytic domain-containing protein [Nitrososphaerota archaeon]MDE1841246.1 aconitase X catalytic domain-containing protein [Nitrososphaerota archaeon]MDE1877641.1 aconitase X catalytic domain-containing protein [Nitrososphaerota archaeon]
MELTKEEEAALDGKQGETLALAYRTLVAIGEASNADRLIPIEWAHLSGVNYNTIGDAGKEFLSHLSKDARFKVKTTVNPMGFDFDSVSQYKLDDKFIENQRSIKNSYEKMGVIPSYSCIPYEIFDVPKQGTHVSFAESNAAIYANSFSGLKTNKEGAFSALASALTGKSPCSDLRDDDVRKPNLTIRMKVEPRDELTYGMLGYFAGKVAGSSVALSGVNNLDRRSCKSLCAGMGTSGACGMFTFGEEEGEKIDFDKNEMQKIHDELNTSEKGDLITLGSPQLGIEEIADLALMLKGRSFQKRCMIFCPRAIKEQITDLGYANEIKRAGGELLYDCCTCLSPLVDNKEVDSVVTNSVKGAYYLRTSNNVDVNLKSLKRIVEEETK